MQVPDQKCNENKSQGEETSRPRINTEAEHVDAAAARLYPELSETEQRQAGANLRRYFEIALSMAEENAKRDASLTERESVSTMKERSNDTLKL
jgi:hypothetical protein